MNTILPVLLADEGSIKSPNGGGVKGSPSLLAGPSESEFSGCGGWSGGSWSG